jgi:hypothetical protein
MNFLASLGIKDAVYAGLILFLGGFGLWYHHHLIIEGENIIRTEDAKVATKAAAAIAAGREQDRRDHEQEIKDYQSKLADADTRAVADAARLRVLAATPRPGPVPGIPGPAASRDGPAATPGSGEAPPVAAVTTGTAEAGDCTDRSDPVDDYACAAGADSTGLMIWQEWYAKAKANYDAAVKGR